MKSFRIVILGVVLSWSLGAHVASAQFSALQCGDLGNHYGPYDYYVDKDKLPIVEKHHFTPKVEMLKGGQEGYIGGDLDYALHAFPNHPRVLIAMLRLAEKEKNRQPQGAKYPVECYLDRAVRFRPNDGMVRVILANYLSKAGKKEEAVKQLEAASEAGVSSPNMDYNMGLAYFEVGDFEKSLKFAHSAYRGGFNLPGLKGKLVKAGKWREPVDPPASDSAKAESDSKTETPAAPK
jgi:tetratricopeptide (TPR) repeat protein